MSFNGENPVITGIEIKFHWFKWEIDPSLSHYYFTNALWWTLNIKITKNNKFDFYYQKALQRCKQITFKHTKGHQHIETFYSKYNNFVDVLARNASNVIKYEKTTSE